MKKILTIFAITSFTAVFSQITITSNIPTNIGSGASIDAEVKINKGGIGNFAKYQMDAPIGYIISAIEVKGGNFTFENQRAKIVWVSIPTDPEVTLKFKIQASSTAVSPGTFSQKFYYLENNEKKEVEGTPATVIIDGGGAAVVLNTPTETKPVETIVTESKTVETKVVETVVTETKPVETKVVETVVTETKPVETKVVETVVTETKPVETIVVEKVIETKKTEAVAKKSNTSEAGTSYRVQLGAFTNEPTKGKFPGAGSVQIEFIDGLHKVTTGNFSSADEATKYRDQLKSKGYNGFVAEYKNGKRVK